MPEITEEDRVRVSRPLSQKGDGREGTVQWTHEHKGQKALGVKLDGDDSGRTFFPHELELIEG